MFHIGISMFRRMISKIVWREKFKAIPHNCGARITPSGFSSIETKTAENP